MGLTNRTMLWEPKSRGQHIKMVEGTTYPHQGPGGREGGDGSAVFLQTGKAFPVTRGSLHSALWWAGLSAGWWPRVRRVLVRERKPGWVVIAQQITMDSGHLLPQEPHCHPQSRPPPSPRWCSRLPHDPMESLIPRAPPSLSPSPPITSHLIMSLDF